MITKRRKLPASAHAKRPTEPAGRDRTPRGAPAAVIARRPAERPAPRAGRARRAPALLIGITPSRPRKPRPEPRSGTPRSPRKPI
jgi:hypothetical protein